MVMWDRVCFLSMHDNSRLHMSKVARMRDDLLVGTKMMDVVKEI
jgi:hypothetical protein